MNKPLKPKQNNTNKTLNKTIIKPLRNNKKPIKTVKTINNTFNKNNRKPLQTIRKQQKPSDKNIKKR